MNEQTDRNDKDAVKNHSATRRFRQRRVLVVALTCVAVLAAVVGLSSDRLSVNSDVQSPLVEEGKEEIAAPAANSAPEILRLTAATDRIAPLDVCELVCEAVDPDNDVLSYTWSSPQGEIHGEGSTIEWVSPGTEGLFRLSVTVNDGSGGAAEYSTSLRVRANCAPDIQSVSASADWVAPGASTYVSCAAEDADGDGITYEWAASAGEVFGEGHSIVWLAPTAPGSYRVTVHVRDTYGGESEREVPIGVQKSDSPTLGKFVVEAIDTDLLKSYGDVWEIYQGRSCSIECVVLNGHGPYSFTWSVDWGELTADGAVATWVAPEDDGPATALVDVTDVHGHTTRGTVLLYVETCTCRFD